jgi:hypothetical protein
VVINPPSTLRIARANGTIGDPVGCIPTVLPVLFDVVAAFTVAAFMVTVELSV